LQTLSKAYGLASLRLGMAFANSKVIDLLNKIKPPYNIGGATQKIVLEALSNKEFLDNSIKSIISSKNELILSLEKFNFVQQVVSSQANFILVKFNESEKLFNYLIRNQIITRNRSKVELCKNAIRITIGLPSENKILIEKIIEFYK
jgi:histidinol-phosphate aminotransferase